MSNDLEKNLALYDVPAKRRCLSVLPNYRENPDKYGIDLIPKQGERICDCCGKIRPGIELQVSTGSQGKEGQSVQPIFVRARKQRFFNRECVFWWLTSDLNFAFELRGDEISNIIGASEPVVLNPAKGNQGWWINPSYFRIRRV